MKGLQNVVSAFLVISLLGVSGCWAGGGRFYRPHFMNRNFNNPYAGYPIDSSNYRQQPASPNYHGFPSNNNNNAFRPFQQNPFGFSQQNPFGDLFNKFIQHQQNQLNNNGFGFSPFGQQNGFPGVVLGQNGSGQEEKARAPAPTTGHRQEYYGPNNPNSSRVPGKENVYTHGEMPSWSGTTAPALPPNPLPTDNLNAQKQPSTAQVPTSAQAPSVLPANAVLTPEKPPLPVPGGQGHHVTGLPAPSKSPTTGQSGNALPAQAQNRKEDGKGRTVSQAPTSSQRPGVLPPGPAKLAYPTSSAGHAPEHHSNSLSPSTAQVPTSGQAPVVLPVNKPDAANQDGSDVLDLDVLEVTVLEDKTTGKELVPASGGKNELPLGGRKEAVPANGKAPVQAESKAPVPVVPEAKKPAEKPSEKKEDDYDYENETFDQRPSDAKTQPDQNKAAESVFKLDVRLGQRRTTVKPTLPVPAAAQSETPHSKPSQDKPQVDKTKKASPAVESPAAAAGASSPVAPQTWAFLEEEILS